MKSKHLAKADFIRRLRELATELYDLGDFTTKNPQRDILSATIKGFVDAGTTLEVVSSQDIQNVIDKVHLSKFGETREARKNRILEESVEKASEDTLEDVVDWDAFDSPAMDRKR